MLFASTGGAGHVRPMLPLAQALRRRGHAVAWATSPDALPALGGLGFEGFAAGPDMPAARLDFARRWPQARALEGEALADFTFARLFGAVLAPAMVAGLEAAVTAWRPELVISEPAALAVPLVCARRGLRHATHAYGLRLPASHLAAAMDALAPWWRRAGLEPPSDAGLYRHLYLDIAPPALQGATDGGGALGVRTLALRPAGASLEDAPPLPPALARALARTARPVVYVSFGTVFNRRAALRAAAQAVGGMDVTAVVTVGHDGEPAALGALPRHVHVWRHVEQAALLPLCQAVVSHAGAGTLLGAAAHGLPQVLLPQAADQFRNARALVATGAARQLMPAQVSTGLIAAALREALGCAAIGQAAASLSREIAAMPAAMAVAALLA